jgi:hypothetical protein
MDYRTYSLGGSSPEMKMESKQMHDWSLVTISVDWSVGCVQLDLCPRPGERSRVIARDFRKVEVPRRQEWGASVSVMSHVGPDECGPELRRLSILMQSGDSIEIVAREIEMPAFS